MTHRKTRPALLKPQTLKDQTCAVPSFSFSQQIPFKKNEASNQSMASLAHRLSLKLFKTTDKYILLIKRRKENSWSLWRREQRICWGLFSAADSSTFDALVSVCGSRLVPDSHTTILVDRCVFAGFVDSKKTHRTSTALSINGVSNDAQ